MAVATWIDRPEALADAAARWQASDADVALDTEFVFERTYRPRLGIIQLAVAGEIALIDGVRLRDLSALGPLLADSRRRKLLHSGSGDIPILRRAGGAALHGLLDTQIAAAFAGLGPSLSYAALVKILLGVELAKHETRTDWTRRPLSPDQLRYAAEDVEYMPGVAAALEEQLRILGRFEWALEDSAALAANDGDTPDPAVAWRRVKGIDRLNTSSRAVARVLAAWREREAELADLARPFLLRDETLVALAKRDALVQADAAALPGYDGRRHAHLTPRWAAALQAARAEVEAGTAPVEDPRTPPEIRDRLEAIGVRVAALVTQKATELGLTAELLLSRRQRERAIETWLRTGGSLAAALGGFRGALLGAELDALTVEG
ncbi:MAG: HRDC domain-containing protein [Vicinamibacteraceae bacterium]